MAETPPRERVADQRHQQPRPAVVVGEEPAAGLLLADGRPQEALVGFAAWPLRVWACFSG